MKKYRKKSLAILLSLTMLFSMLPGAQTMAEEVRTGGETEVETHIDEAAAEEILTDGEAAGKRVIEPEYRTENYEAESDSVVLKSALNEVLNVTEPVTIEAGGILEFDSDSLSKPIQRDYEQSIDISVKNLSGEAQVFYLEIENDYDDLSMQIVREGSKENPRTISPGGNAGVCLSVFAQNAESMSYTIPVTAYVKKGEEFVSCARDAVQITISTEKAELELYESGDPDPGTLSKTFEVREDYSEYEDGAESRVKDLTVYADGGLENYVSFSPTLENYAFDNDDKDWDTDKFRKTFKVYPDLKKMKDSGKTEFSGTIIARGGGSKVELPCTFTINPDDIDDMTMEDQEDIKEGNPAAGYDLPEGKSEDAEYRDPADNKKDLPGSPAAGDIVNDDDSISFQYDSKLKKPDGTDSETASSEITIKIGKDEGGSDEGEDVQVDHSGNVTIKYEKVITKGEYEELIKKLGGEKTVGDGNYRLEVTEKLTGLDDVFDSIPSGPDYLRSLLNALTRGSRGYYVNEDPRLTEEKKNKLLGLSILEAQLDSLQKGLSGTAYEPPVSFAGERVKNRLEELEKDLTEDPGSGTSAVVNKTEGHQCTNRLKVDHRHYFRDYRKAPITGMTLRASGSSDEKPRIFATSRMYGGRYVDRTETDYDILLNGVKVTEAKTAGVTDVLIAEIPNEELRMGETNLFTFDYRTNPGSHSVTAESQITALYPSDTPVAYVRDEIDKDNLEDVRRLPDFAIYPENIVTASSDLIIGEENEVIFKVYNIGSKGGWFKIDAKYRTEDSENAFELRREKTDERDGEGTDGGYWYYLDAFDQTAFKASFVPQAESTPVKVEVSSWDNKDGNSENNNISYEDEYGEGSKNLIARSRQVPSVVSRNGILTEEMPFNLLFDVENIMDLADKDDISISLDGKPLEGNPVATLIERYDDDRSTYIPDHLECLYSGPKPLSYGDHTISITAEYYTSSTEKIRKEIGNYVLRVTRRAIIEPKVEFTYDPDRDEETIEIEGIEDLVNAKILVNGKIINNIIPADYDREEGKLTHVLDTSGYGDGYYDVAVRLSLKHEELESTKIEKGSFNHSTEERAYYLIFDEVPGSPDFYYDYRFEYDGEYGVHYTNDGWAPVRAEKLSDKEYKILRKDIPGANSIMVIHSRGISVVAAGGSRINVELSDSRRLSFKESSLMTLKEASITSVQTAATASLYKIDFPKEGDEDFPDYRRSFALASGDVAELSDGITVRFTAETETAGTPYTFTSSVYMDKNRVLDLENYTVLYSYKVMNSGSEEFHAALAYSTVRNRYSTYNEETGEWDDYFQYRYKTQNMGCVFDRDKKILSCFLLSPDENGRPVEYSVVKNGINSGDKAYMMIWSEDEIFKDDLKEEAPLPENGGKDGNIKILDKVSLNSMSVKCRNERLSYSSVTVPLLDDIDYDSDRLDITLTKDRVFMPSSNYALGFAMAAGKQRISNQVNKDIKEKEVEVFADEGIGDNLSETVIAWSGSYEKEGSVNEGESGTYVAGFQNGDGLWTVAGKAATINTSLLRQDKSFNVYRSFESYEGSRSVDIGNTFEAEPAASDARHLRGGFLEKGKYVTLPFTSGTTEMKDTASDNNLLKSITAGNGGTLHLYGKAVFKNRDNGEEVIRPVNIHMNSTFQTIYVSPGYYPAGADSDEEDYARDRGCPILKVQLPSEAGRYTVSYELYSDVKKDRVKEITDQPSFSDGEIQEGFIKSKDLKTRIKDHLRNNYAFTTYRNTIIFSSGGKTLSDNGVEELTAGTKVEFTSDVMDMEGNLLGYFDGSFTVRSGNETDRDFKVTFDPDNGKEEIVRTAKPGGTVVLPDTPVKSGSKFAGWYTKKNGEGSAFTSRTAVTEDITVFAYWKPEEKEERIPATNITDEDKKPDVPDIPDDSGEGEESSSSESENSAGDEVSGNNGGGTPEKDPNDAADPFSVYHENDGSSFGTISAENARYAYDPERSKTVIAGLKNLDISAKFRNYPSQNNYDPSAKHRYRVDNKKIAKVSKKGLLSVKKGGMFRIFLEQKAKGSGWTQIGEPVTMYSQMPAMIKKDNLSLPSGGTGNAYKYLSRTSYSPTRWISTKDSVASVSEDGTITPHSKGSTKLIAQYGDGKGSSGKKYKTKLKLTIN